MLGTNARMTELQAGIGLEQLKKLSFYVQERNRIADIYIDLLKKYKVKIELPKFPKEYKPSYFFFPILIAKRNYIAKTILKKFNIDTRIAYPKPIYEQPMYKYGNLVYKKNECYNAEYFCKKILNLPIYPYEGK